MPLQPVWTDFVSGTLSNDLPVIAAGATQTMQSPGLATLGGVSSGAQFAKIVLDPFAVNGLPELVWAIVHGNGATSATIQRLVAQPLRDHPPGETWVHGPTAEDFSDMQAKINNFSYQTVQATVSGGPTSGSTELTIATLNISSQIAPYQLDCAAFWSGTFSDAADFGDFRVKVAGIERGRVTDRADGTNDRRIFSIPTTTLVSVAAATPIAVTCTIQRSSGTGTITTNTSGLVTARMSFFS